MCAPIIVRIAEPNHARKGGFNLPREVALEPASGCGYGDHAAHPGRAVAWQGATKRVVAPRRRDGQRHACLPVRHRMDVQPAERGHVDVVLLFRRQSLGYVLAPGLLLQFGLTPVALAAGMAFQPVLTASPIDVPTVTGLLVFAAVSFLPLVYLARSTRGT